jgi:hypothetical protein
VIVVVDTGSYDSEGIPRYRLQGRKKKRPSVQAGVGKQRLAGNAP